MHTYIRCTAIKRLKINLNPYIHSYTHIHIYAASLRQTWRSYEIDNTHVMHKINAPFID